MARPFVILALALSSALAASACGESDARAPRCGRTYVANGAWVGTGIGVGAGYGVGYYDPYDVYDPSVDYGTYDPESGDPGSPGDPGAPSADDDTPSTDGTGDESGGWDTPDPESMARLHFTAAPAQSAAPDANGCYLCTISCVAGVGAEAAGRQATGVSDVSYDDACDSATRSLAYWAHAAQHARLTTCQKPDAASSTRAPAMPTPAGSAR